MKQVDKQINPLEKRLRRRSRRRFSASVALLVITLLVGGSFVAVLLRLDSLGMLDLVIDVIKSIFFYNEVNNTLIVFWMLAIPLILCVIVVILIIRRNRFKYFKRTLEDTARLAVEEERKAARAEAERRNRTNRFSRLNEIKPQPPSPETYTVTSLKELCDNFRAYAANVLHYYYPEEQIRSFIAGLAVSHIMIIQGMSGTGKTSLTYAFGSFIGNSATIIPVQPMWKERSDLLGYYNEFTRKYNETELLRKMYEANGSDEIYLTVLDEMNIARVEYYFAEFLSLLEIPDPELRYLEVVSDKWDDDPAALKDGRIKLPVNMWFIGTANNDDSTFAISDKVYDRAMIVNLDTRILPFSVDRQADVTRIGYREFSRLIDDAQRSYEITRRNERRLKELDAILLEKFQITFGNRIMRQIRNFISVYVSCGGDELDALDDILCKKVFRKLVYRDLGRLHAELKDVAASLQDLFGETRMPQCREFLEKIAKQ